jgi:cyanate permease
MKVSAAVIGLLVLLPVAAFSVFGFLAAFEPVDNALAFRIGYAALFTGCLVSAGLLIRSAIRN